MSSPLVSVIIPTYNYAHYIARAIESVLEQVYGGDVEIIVVDDGSNDNTAAVVEPYIIKNQLRYHWQPNEGKAIATERAINLASGDIIFNLDADDWFLPGKIQETVTAFLQYPGLVHVATPAVEIEPEKNNLHGTTENIPVHLLGTVANGENTLRFFLERKLLFGGGTTFAAKASVLKKINWRREIDMYTDEWLLIETLLHGDSYFIPHPLSVWYVHGKNYSAGKLNAGMLEDKYKRLECSSSAIYGELQKGKYSNWLLKIYNLRHSVRTLMFKEELGSKSLKDCVGVFYLILFCRHRLSVLQSYHVFNRILPIGLQRIVRRLRKVR